MLSELIEALRCGRGPSLVLCTLLSQLCVHVYLIHPSAAYFSTGEVRFGLFSLDSLHSLESSRVYTFCLNHGLKDHEYIFVVTPSP